MISEIEYWSDFPAAGGRRQGSIYPIKECKMSQALDGSDEMRMVAPQAVLAPVQRGMVVRGTDSLGVVREYRVRSRRYVRGSPTRTITGLSVRDELGRAGVITQTIGGYTSVDVGGSRIPASWIDDVILPFLASKGMTYFVRGTVDVTTVAEIEALPEGYSCLSLLLAIQSKIGGEFRVRAIGETQYAIDYVQTIGSGSAVVPVGFSRNLIELQETEDDEGLVSAITGLGITPDGDIVRATLAENAWKVGTPVGSGPYWLPLTDPDGGDAPVAFDNQFGSVSPAQAAYLLLKDATTVEILSSRRSDSAVQVSSLTGISADDLVQIVANSSGNRIIEITNPNVSPRNAKVSNLPTYRGERNLARNGMFKNWTDVNNAMHWSAAGTSSGNVKASRYPKDANTTNTVAAFTGTTAVPYAASTPYTTFSYTGATPGMILLSGETLLVSEGSFQFGVMIDYNVGIHVVGGTGSGTVACASFTPAVSYDAGRTIRMAANWRPSTWPDERTEQIYAAYLLGTANNAPPIASNARLQSLPFKVKYLTGFGTVRAAVGFTYRSQSASGAVNAAMAIIDTVTGAPNGTVLATVSSTASFSAAGTIHENLMCAASIVADKTLALALYRHNVNNTATFIRWATLWIGSGETPPPIGDSSFANAIWQKVNRELIARALGSRSISFTLRDLSYVAGYMVSAEQIVLGGSVLIEDLGLTLRVVAITYDLVDPENTTVVVDSRPASLIRYLVETL